MNKQTKTKTREVDREQRTRGWTGLGFVIVLIAALVAAILLFVGDG